MGTLTEYVIPRVCTYILTIFIGITVCFLIPRLTPSDPVLAVVSRLSQYGEYYDPQALQMLIESMKELYGLKGSLLDQYITFLKRLTIGDFGPSLAYFPTPATLIFQQSLPWTISLLSMSTLISWILGNFIGGVAGYFSERRWAKALGVFATIVYPMPYYIMALILVIFLAYIIPLFPSYGAFTILTTPSITLEFILDYLYHVFLPALSLVIVGYGWWFLSMRALVINVKSEDYIQFGKATGISGRKLLYQYVIRNSLLPQVTGLSVSIGGIFNGAVITEAVFSYPGVGYILLESILNGDFNLMMASVAYSIIAVATATLLIDLLYPLVDPRIRYK
jgi:peptide/nickel transport system permease protein